MTAWLVWTAFASALIAVAAVTLERAIAFVGGRRRVVWIGAMAAVVVVPLALALRVAPPDSDGATLGAGTMNASGRYGPMTALTASDERRAGFAQPFISTMNGRADRWLGLGWITASLVLLVSFGRSVLGLRRQRARWRLETTEMGRVLVSPDVGPAVVGFFRPQVVVPTWALSVGRTTRELMLRHEREHIRAGDMLLLLAGELARIAFPWNAALWWIDRRLRLAIELDCDARVIRAVGSAHAYGSLLLSVSERRASPLSLATPLSEPNSTLEARINAMTSSRPRRPLLSALPLAAITLAVLTMVAWAPQPAPLRAQATVPKPLRGNGAPPYPDSLRAAGIEGHADITFTVDARGIPDTSTLRVLESSHDLFARSIRTTMSRWRFDSAGSVRLLFRFLSPTTVERERAGLQPAPRFAANAVPGWTVYISSKGPGAQ